MSPTFMVSYALLWVLVVALAIALLGLYYHFAQLYVNSREGREAQGPELGKPIARIAGRLVAGGTFDLPVRGNPSLIVVTSTECGICNDLKPELAVFAARAQIETIVVCAGPREQVEGWTKELRPFMPVLVDADRAITSRLKVNTLPYCVGTDSEGNVKAKGLVNGVRGLEWAADATLATEVAGVA